MDPRLRGDDELFRAGVHDALFRSRGDTVPRENDEACVGTTMVQISRAF